MKALTLLLLLFLGQITFAKSAMPLDQKVKYLFGVVSNEIVEKRALLEISEFCNSLKKFNNLSPKLKLRRIFSQTKKTFLYDYKRYAFFPDIFTERTFNCVTGTALFAIIFDELDIPYNIVKMPNHAYLIAYPNQYDIGIESTRK